MLLFHVIQCYSSKLNIIFVISNYLESININFEIDESFSFSEHESKIWGSEILPKCSLTAEQSADLVKTKNDHIFLSTK